MNSQKEDKLRHSSGDYAHAIVKAGISAIPLIGAPASELFSAIINPPLSKRRDEWIREIAEGLKRLEEKVEGFKAENLSQNEMFITTVMYASRAAIHNHQSEKFKALRNAVLNSAIPNNYEDDIQLIFINYIDSLTPWHIKVIDVLNKPKNFINHVTFSDPEEFPSLWVLEKMFPELKGMRGKRGFLSQILRDLINRGLISDNKIYKGGPESFTSPVTDFGKQFLEFIFPCSRFKTFAFRRIASARQEWRYGMMGTWEATHGRRIPEGATYCL